MVQALCAAANLCSGDCPSPFVKSGLDSFNPATLVRFRTSFHGSRSRQNAHSRKWWCSLNAQRQLHPGEKCLGLYWLGGVTKQHLLGWILTVLALSLGAPFWFDTLNRFMN